MKKAQPEQLDNARLAALAALLAAGGRYPGDAAGHAPEVYRLLIESSPDVVCLLDGDGVLRFVNEATGRLLGHRPQALLGQEYAALVDAEDMEVARNLFDAQRPGAAVRHADLRLRRHSSRAGPRPQQSMRMWTAATVTHLYQGARFVGAHLVARDISERREARRATTFQAYHDVLTRLPNRALLKDRLSLAIEQAGRHRRRLTVAFVDLDRFKLVNDKHGHAVGDRLLQAVARRLRDCVRRGDTLARYGGDEFALVLPDVRERAAAVGIGNMLVAALREPFTVDGKKLRAPASIGVALYPSAGGSAEALLANADVAMYHAKGGGGDACSFFTGEMNRRFSVRQTMERELRRAVANGEIEVRYQPQVRLRDGAIVGLEALARWRRAGGELAQASEFLPLAEETGLIAQIDQLVQREAFAQVAAWRGAGFPHCRVAVNVSAGLLDETGCVPGLEAGLEATGLPPAAVTLEVTEHALTHDPELVVPKLRHLRHLGARIAIDEFGAGFSSLGQLRRLPLDALKIDRGFVADLSGTRFDARAVDAVAGACRGLALHLLAEGIERQAQLDYLIAAGCRQAQGYLFSPPVAADAVPALLREGGYRLAPEAAPKARARPLPSTSRDKPRSAHPHRER